LTGGGAHLAGAVSTSDTAPETSERAPLVGTNPAGALVQFYMHVESSACPSARRRPAANKLVDKRADRATRRRRLLLAA
jgi:hypothetical protein